MNTTRLRGYGRRPGFGLTANARHVGKVGEIGRKHREPAGICGCSHVEPEPALLRRTRGELDGLLR